MVDPISQLFGAWIGDVTATIYGAIGSILIIILLLVIVTNPEARAAVIGVITLMIKYAAYISALVFYALYTTLTGTPLTPPKPPTW